MACHDRGIALLTVLYVTALLAGLALLLSGKVWHSLQAGVEREAVDRLRRAAASGIEWARRELVVRYRSSGQWQDYLAAAPPGGRYPTTPTMVPLFDGIRVELFLRDNPDGDDAFDRDNDLRIYLLARAVDSRGRSAQVEAQCELHPSGVGRGRPTAGGGSLGFDTTDPTGLPTETFIATD